MTIPTCGMRAGKKYRDEKGRLLRGCPPGPGRPKGLRDKMTVLREAVADIALGPAGRDAKRTYQQALAKAHPKAFSSLIGRLLGGEPSAEARAEVTLLHPDVAGPGQEVARVAVQVSRAALADADADADDE